MTEENGEGFRITLRMVWDELQAVKKEQAQTREHLTNEISGLKVKSGVWGILGALIVVAPAVLALISIFGGKS